MSRYYREDDRDEEDDYYRRRPRDYDEERDMPRRIYDEDDDGIPSGRRDNDLSLPYGGRLDSASDGADNRAGASSGFGRGLLRPQGRGGGAQQTVSGTLSAGWRRDKVRGFLATARQDNWKLIVMKVTNRDVAPPKAKHVQTIMQGVDFGGNDVLNRETASGAVLHHLSKRAREPDWLVATKALTVLHFSLRMARNKAYVSALCGQERQVFALDNFQDEYPDGYAFVPWVKSYAKYLFQWCECKAKIDYPPSMTEDDRELDEGVFPKRFVRMKAKDLMKSAPLLLVVLDKMFRLELDGPGGRTPVSGAALGLIVKDLSHFWISLAEAMTTLADEFTHLGSKEARHVLDIHKDYADLLDRAPKFFDALSRCKPDWSKPTVTPIPQELIDDMEDQVRNGGSGFESREIMAPVMTLSEFDSTPGRRQGGYGGYGARDREPPPSRYRNIRDDYERPSYGGRYDDSESRYEEERALNEDPFLEPAKEDPFAPAKPGGGAQNRYKVSIEETSSEPNRRAPLPTNRAIAAGNQSSRYSDFDNSADDNPDPFLDLSQGSDPFGLSGDGNPGSSMMPGPPSRNFDLVPTMPTMQQDPAQIQRMIMLRQQQNMQMAMAQQQMMQQQMMQQQMMQQQMMQQQMMMAQMGQMNLGNTSGMGMNQARYQQAQGAPNQRGQGDPRRPFSQY